jgi:putative phosphoribosyl transferase
MIFFKDRRDAGRKLAKKLSIYRGTDAIIVALPRGGVIVAHEIACQLNLPLDIVVTRKIEHPASPEYAIGVVDENGERMLNEREVASVDKVWLEKEIRKEEREAKRRNEIYRKGKGSLMLTDKVVILVDDGIATGFTMRLAVIIVQKQWPRKLIVAVPVAPQEAVAFFEEIADSVIVLEDPLEFRGSIGLHYVEFPQADDDEIIGLLHSSPLEVGMT